MVNTLSILIVGHAGSKHFRTGQLIDEAAAAAVAH
jgi:hypothetical protein